MRSLARRSHFAGCMRDLLGILLCNCAMRGFLSTNSLCNFLSTNSLCNLGGSKCTKVRGASANIAGLPHIGVTWLLASPLCQRCSKLLCARPSNESGLGSSKWMGTWKANAVGERDGPWSYFGVLPHHREQSVTKWRTQDCSRGQGGRVM